DLEILSIAIALAKQEKKFKDIPSELQKRLKPFIENTSDIQTLLTKMNLVINSRGAQHYCNTIQLYYRIAKLLGISYHEVTLKSEAEVINALLEFGFPMFSTCAKFINVRGMKPRYAA